MKKKLFLMILLFVFVSPFIKCLEYSDYSLSINGFFDMKLHNGKIYILGNRTIQLGGYHPCVIKYYDGIKWDSLPEKYFVNDEEKQLYVGSTSRINFDSSGTLWLNSKSLMCYKDNKWNEYFIDDTMKDYRTYEEFCIDKYNNIWIKTMVYKKSEFGYSEVFKFDGTNFISALKSNYVFAFTNRTSYCKGNVITALPDGRVCFLRYYNKYSYDSDYDPNLQDIYFFNQDLTYTKTKLKVYDSQKWDTMPKNPINICPESSDKIWFCTEANTGSINGKKVSICSGLSLYEKGNWTVFNEDNGLDYTVDEGLNKSYRIVFNVTKISSENYLVTAYSAMYLMGSDNKLKRINCVELGKKAKIIVANDVREEYQYKQELNLLFETNGKSLSTPGAIIPYNGEIWLMTTVGILVFKEDAITSVEDERQTNENESALYPNPAKDILNIQDYLQYSNYEIYDLLGKKVSSGVFSKNYIDVNSLANGNYYIILHTNNKTYHLKYFVKE